MSIGSDDSASSVALDASAKLTSSGSTPGIELPDDVTSGKDTSSVKSGCSVGGGARTTLGSTGGVPRLGVETLGTLIRVAHFGQRPLPPPALSGTRITAVQYGQLNSMAMRFESR